MGKPFGESLLVSHVTFLCMLVCAQPSFAQTFQRLPRVYSIAQLDRLPSTDDESEINGPLGKDRQATRFAAGAIQLHVPHGWWSGEVPFGREMRLVIAPQRPVNVRRMPLDGMWLAYHPAADSESQNGEGLLRELSLRLRAAETGNAQYSPPTLFRYANWPAAVAEFTSEPSTASARVTGRHALVRTDWGLFEFHASAPDALAESRSKLWAAVWDSLRLNAPAVENAPLQEADEITNPIIGDWKSYRSRMRFSKDGRIVIVPDALAHDSTSRPLTGTFESRDDLVFVRWDDGSRLNFRWRIQGNDLFLTDHEGQISQLKRVFN